MSRETDRRLERSRIILGDDALIKLALSRVAVFGLGGVGGAAAEALARGGVGTLFLIDNDRVEISNLNRQIIALESTIGRYKCEIMAERAVDINPGIKVYPLNIFFDGSAIDKIDFSSIDYIVDAIDSVPSKILLIETAKKYNIPIISCMGMGNRIFPDRIFVADIYETSVCPLAKIIRKAMRERGISNLKVVYSDETPVKSAADEGSITVGSLTVGSVPFVPPVAGYIMAGEVIRDLSYGVGTDNRNLNLSNDDTAKIP